MIQIYPQQLTKEHIDMLKRSISRDKRTNISRVMKRLYEGTAGAFKSGESIYTLEAWPDCLHIAQMCGSMKDIPQMKVEVIALAKSMGKAYIELNGRPGWARALKHMGFKQHNEVLRLTL